MEVASVESLVGASKFNSLCGGSLIAFKEGENSLKLSLSLPVGRHPDFDASTLSVSATGDEHGSATGSCSTCVGDGVTSSEAI